MRGRKPLPTNVHVLNGNPGKRARPEQPKIEIEAPPCPSWLPKEAKAEWSYIVKELKRYGIVTKLDKAALAAYCSAAGLLRIAEEKLKAMENHQGYLDETPNGMAIQSVWFQIRNKAIEQIMKTAPEFGLTPSARARVKIQQPEQGDFFEHL